MWWGIGIAIAVAVVCFSESYDTIDFIEDLVECIFED